MHHGKKYTDHQALKRAKYSTQTSKRGQRPEKRPLNNPGRRAFENREDIKAKIGLT